MFVWKQSTNLLHWLVDYSRLLQLLFGIESFFLVPSFRLFLWRSVAKVAPVNHKRFPGLDVLESALLNGQTWFARSGARVAELRSPVSHFHGVIGVRIVAAAEKKKKTCRTDGQSISSFWHSYVRVCDSVWMWVLLCWRAFLWFRNFIPMPHFFLLHLIFLLWYGRMMNSNLVENQPQMPFLEWRWTISDKLVTDLLAEQVSPFVWIVSWCWSVIAYWVWSIDLCGLLAGVHQS